LSVSKGEEGRKEGEQKRKLKRGIGTEKKE
jgi:hypothetical protein